MRPRLIATDLDGTIVHHDGSVSERTLTAFSAAMDVGVRVVFVTGRPPRWMGEVADATGHRGVGICANGAYLYDMHTEQVLETHAIEATVASDAVRRVREVLPHAAFGIETLAGFAHEPEYLPRWDPDPLLGVGPIEEFLEGSIAKVLVRDDRVTGDVMLSAGVPGAPGRRRGDAL